MAERGHDHLEEAQVLLEVLGRRLRLDAFGHDVVEVLQLVGVRVLEGGAGDALGVGVADRLLDDQRRRQVADVRRVVLDANRLGRAVDLDVGVEAALLVDALRAEPTAEKFSLRIE